MKNILSVVLAILLMAGVVIPAYGASGDFNNSLTIYPEYDERITRDYDYSVSVAQGDTSPISIPVYNRNNSATLFFNRIEASDYNRRFCEFAFSGQSVTVTITPHFDFTSYTVMPSAKKFESVFSNGSVIVTVNNPDEVFLIKFNNDDNTILSVFADAEENYNIDKNDPSVLYIDEKWVECADNNTLSFYETSNFVKKTDVDGDTVITNKWGGKTPVTTLYIAPGSVLDARIFTWYPGITIIGHGMILDPYSNIFENDITKSAKKRAVEIESKDCTVKDIKIVDSQYYNLTIGTYGNNCEVSNVKILSETITTDGISVFGADDVRISNCFIYCGDNAIVFGERNKNNVYENNIIGTTCAAFCPQEELPYELLVKNNYVFRCDEGCINYWYCNSETTVANLVFDGLDCVDVKNIPWLFSTRDSGYREKNFTFKNVSLCNVRGNKTLSIEPTATEIDLITRDSHYKKSGNYNLYIENLFVNGTAKKAYSDLKINNPAPDENNVLVSYNSIPENISLKSSVKKVNYKYPFKVYIGKSLQKMETQPVKQNRTVYLPYYEMCNKLNKTPTVNPELVSINGVQMIDINKMSSILSPMKYEEKTGSIMVENIKDYSTNLLSETSKAFSRWSGATAYNTDLTTYVENGKTVYKIKELVTAGNNGIMTFLTDEVKKNGPAVYRMTFKARTMSDDVQTGLVTLKDRNGLFDIENPVEFNTTWNDYSLLFDIDEETDVSKILECYMFIMNDNSGDFDVEIKDISLTVEKYNQKPEIVSTPCSCNCHKNNFLWKLQSFFWKIFARKKHAICDCGINHW